MPIRVRVDLQVPRIRHGPVNISLCLLIRHSQHASKQLQTITVESYRANLSHNPASLLLVLILGPCADGELDGLNNKVDEAGVTHVVLDDVDGGHKAEGSDGFGPFGVVLNGTGVGLEGPVV